jgi:hypothetical protein
MKIALSELFGHKSQSFESKGRIEHKVLLPTASANQPHNKLLIHNTSGVYLNLEKRAPSLSGLMMWKEKERIKNKVSGS